MSPKKDTAHTKYPRGSHFYALSNCDASFSLSQASGEEPPTAFSDRGSDVHALIAGKAKPEDFEDGIREEARALQILHDVRLGEWALSEGDILVVTEKRLWLRQGMRPIYSGQPDEYVVQGARVFLSDYKTAWHPLDDYVATNCQIRAYVPLIDAELGGALQQITAAIHKPGKQSPPALFERAEINEARAWAKEVAFRAMAKGDKHPTRGPWCKYCSGKVLCPLWREELLSLAELSSAIAADVPDSMLRALAPKLELAAAVCERLLARLYERARANPAFFRDWHFEPASPRRSITDLIETYNILVAREKVLSPADFLFCCRIAVTELEKRVGANRKLSVHGAGTLLGDLLGALLEHKRGKDRLVYDPKNILPP